MNDLVFHRQSKEWNSVSEGESNREPPRFVSSSGSRVGGQHKDKKQRITDALSDLRLVLAGIASGGEGRRKAGEMTQETGSLARACSVFLRKVVLGEGRNRDARLLDDTVLESLEMSLQPLRKIPSEGRRQVETGFRMERAVVELLRLDDTTGEPVKKYRAEGGVQGLSIVLEWPLVGVADWLEPRTAGTGLWQVAAGQLFDTQSTRSMRCNEWLGQQIVMFDGQGISLEKLIRTTANLEGAHAVNVGRLAAFEGEAPSNAMKEPHVHILRNIAFFGVGYAEIVLVEAGLYLFERLIKEPSIQRPSGSSYMFTPAVECPAEGSMSSRPSWLQYRGAQWCRSRPIPASCATRFGPRRDVL